MRKRDPLDRAGNATASFSAKMFGSRDVGTAKPGPVSKGEEFDGKGISSIEQLSGSGKSRWKSGESLYKKRMRKELEKASALRKQRKKRQVPAGA